MGNSIEKRLPLSASWWGWALAIALHVIWNFVPVYINQGSLNDLLTGSGADPANISPIAALLISFWAFGFFLYFIVLMTFLISKRSHLKTRFDQQVAWLVHYYRLPTTLVNVFFNRDTIKAARKAQPRKARVRLDEIQSNLTRLGELHDYYHKHGHLVHPHRKTEQQIVAELDVALQAERDQPGVFVPSGPNQNQASGSFYDPSQPTIGA